MLSATKRVGSDVTIVAAHYMLHLALLTAEELGRDGRSVEVIDPRTVAPLDMETILNSVRKTGRLVVVSEDTLSCGFASEVVSRVAETCPEVLKAPMQRVCTLDVPIPFAPEAERFVLPDRQKIHAAIEKVCPTKTRVRSQTRAKALYLVKEK